MFDGAPADHPSAHPGHPDLAVWRVTSDGFTATVTIGPAGAIVAADPRLAGWRGRSWDRLFKFCREVGWRFVYEPPPLVPPADQPQHVDTE